MIGPPNGCRDDGQPAKGGDLMGSKKQQPWYQGPWRRVRLTILERDGYLCRIKGPKCTVIATQVDHIVPVKPDGSGGAWFEPANLRAACFACNRDRVENALTRLVAKPKPDGPPPGTPSRRW